MKAVHYKDLAGNPRTIQPIQPYTRTCNEQPDGFADIEYKPATVEHGSMGELIGYAMGIVASKPEFIEPHSVPWVLAYMGHIRDLFEQGEFVENGGDWRVRQQVERQIFNHEGADLIYVTRLVGALDVLSMLAYGGEFTVTDDDGNWLVSYSVESFCPKSSMLSRLAADMAGVFDLKAVKTGVTRNFFRGIYVEFVVPKGEQLSFTGLLRGHRPYGLGSRVVGIIERFHKTNFHWSHRKYAEAVPVREGPGYPAFARITHAVTPCEVSRVQQSSTGLGSLMTDACFYLPHEWITGIIRSPEWEPEIVPVSNHA